MQNCPHPELSAVADLPALVPLEQLAGFLHVNVRTVRRWMREGKIRAYRTSPCGSGRVLVARAEVTRLLSELAVAVPFRGGRE